MSLPPKHVQVLVIGGGPGGAYAAAALAREGVDVAVLEAAKFPRYHVGESLIPSVRHYMRFIGAEEKLAAHGFVRKPGSAIKFNQYKREGYTDFIALGHNNNAWNVVRSEFDQILLTHARSCNAKVYEQTRVISLQFSSTDPSKPISASWSSTPTGLPKESQVTGTTTFNYLIDASGRAGIISNTYLKNRHFNASLKNIAVWGYWTDVATYGKGTPREGSPWFEALVDESGWAWFIPLHNSITSIGVVMNQKSSIKKTKKSSPNSTLTSRYLSFLNLAPGVVRLIGKGTLIVGEGEAVRSASDFSYSAPSYAGNKYRIVGDAGAFIDPFFSSGIHLALTSALSAASTICAVLRGDCSEKEGGDWHTKRVATSYTRFQVVVLSAYKQMRAQNINVLCDIDEDNYDRAFAFLRPVIQGASDMGTRLSETELQKSLDFCVNLFNPTTPEQHERVGKLGSEMSDKGALKMLLDVAAPVVDPAVLEVALKVEMKVTTVADGIKGITNDLTAFCIPFQRDRSLSTCSTSSISSEEEKTAETKMVLHKINARRVVQSEYGINNLESEPLDGYVVRLQRGRLGLMKAEALN